MSSDRASIHTTHGMREGGGEREREREGGGREGGRESERERGREDGEQERGSIYSQVLHLH